MKKYAAIAALLLITVQSQAQREQPLSKFQSPNYEIKGQLRGLKNQMVYLANHYADKQYYKDSAMTDALGRFTFKRDNRIDHGLYIIYSPPAVYFEMIITEPSFSFEADTSNIITSIRYKGSPENERFSNYQRTTFLKSEDAKKLQNMREHGDKKWAEEQLARIELEIKNHRDSIIRNYPGTFLAAIFKALIEPVVPEPPADEPVDSNFAYRFYKTHFWDSMDLSDDRLMYSPFFAKKLETYMTRLVIQLPDSIIKEVDWLISKISSREQFKYTVFWTTNHYERSQIMCHDAVFAHMGLKYYTPERAWWVDSITIEKIRGKASRIYPTLCGKVAPNIRMQDSAGRWQELHKIKKDFTVLYMWDPDCSHCRKETPKLQKIYEEGELAGKFQVFAVGVEYEYKKWTDYIREHKHRWIDVIDTANQSNYRAKYEFNSTPVIYILDKDKKIIAKGIGVPQMEDILRHEMGLPPVVRPKEEESKDDGDAH